MYKFNEIQRVNLEVSSLCQASCPMCARNYHGGLPNPNLIEKNMDLKFYKQIFDIDFLTQLTSIYIHGNFGDPILNNDLIPIMKYTVEHNPNIDIHIHTNGSARNIKWWEELAKTLPDNHMVFFGIDGLEDTNHLYRIGTDFNLIMRNAEAFIKSGGKARWDFITFKHNEHQIETAKQLANQLGFKGFHEKQTSRFIGSKEFQVFDKHGNLSHTLSAPTEQKISFVDRNTVKNYKDIFKSATINCEAESDNSIYIDSLGYLWPCCFLAGVLAQYARTEDLVFDFISNSSQTLLTALEPFGGLDGLHLEKHSIKEIVDSDVWQTVWDYNFKNKSILMCSRTCGNITNVNFSQWRDQFVELNNFN